MDKMRIIDKTCSNCKYVFRGSVEVRCICKDEITFLDDIGCNEWESNASNLSNSKHKMHMDICEELNATYVAKNTAYGDSVNRTFKDYGFVSYATRIADKYYRIMSLTNGVKNSVEDEKLEDTLIDMANYCILALIELKMQKEGATNDEN